MIEHIVKRSGKTEAFDPDKLNDLGAWAVENTECSWPLLVTSAVKKLYEGCTSKELMKAMIDSANDMIESDYDWQYVAARLCVADIRKDVYASFTPPPFKEFYHEMVMLGRWKDLGYSDEELDYLDSVIDHDKDENFTYSGIKQVLNKYLITDLHTKQLYETPQMMYMGVAMAGLGSTENKQQRLEEVAKYYQRISDWVVNIPTPQLRSLRTDQTGLASCCLIEGGDTLDSIDISSSVAFQMTARGAGIGLSLDCRSIGDPVREGQVKHGGKLPYYRYYDRAVKANVQPGRGGSATVFYSCFDPEIETLLKLKSDKVSEAVRIKHMDYGMRFNSYLLKRISRDEDITLFSILEAPEVYETFYSKNIEDFVTAYEAAEKRLPKAKKVKVLSIFTERALMGLETGRVYLMEVHETNRRSTFKDQVRQSNLCLEIAQAAGHYTDPRHLYDYEEHKTPDGRTSEISLCTLAAYNIDQTADLSNEELEEVCYLTVKYLDNLIDEQSYPYPNMEMTAKARRNLGIGLTNLAGALANRMILWCSRESRTWLHEQMERISYFNHKASVQLAKERGPCKWFDRTTYSEGTLPIDNFKPFVDTVHDAQLQMPWEKLREGMLTYGMRHSVLEAQMPCESSSQATCSTNGVEPPRKVITSKDTEQGLNKFVIPYAKEKEYFYQLAWDVDNKNHLALMGIIQKFMGQSISTNTYYNYANYPDEEVPMQDLLGDLLWGTKLGLKTWYYTNTDTVEHDDCEGCSV